jgi:hypothetical protein
MNSNLDLILNTLYQRQISSREQLLNEMLRLTFSPWINPGDSEVEPQGSTITAKWSLTPPLYF